MIPLRALMVALGLFLPFCASATPVEFSFKLKRTDGNPFAREIWAEVVSPDGKATRLPAYLSAKDTWSVRRRAVHSGTYRLGAVHEVVDTGPVPLVAKKLGPTSVTVRHLTDTRGPIGIDPRNPRRFAFTDGTPYVPLGANLAWPHGPRSRYYAHAFAKLHQAGLNWSRLWMCHWGGTNLDWPSDDRPPTHPFGTLDLHVATFWDSIVESAEESSIYFQLVLQHHGQWTTGANSNWQTNPWNVANGGFLKSPKDFFTDVQARTLTKQKYRYIVARWGYSSSIMAWELFNEVMWTDSRAGSAEDNAAVAAWHAEMAAYLRSIDAHRHLVTTSDDYLDHPLYAAMDYYQPHNYPADLLQGVRHFDIHPNVLDRPVFYGEVGEDNVVRLTDAQKQDRQFGTPMLWAGLMNDGSIPTQLWYTEEYLAHGHLDEFATLARFFREVGLDHRADLIPFTTVVESTEQLPLIIHPALNWHGAKNPALAPPLDGQVPSFLALVPRYFVSAVPDSGQRFAGRLTLQLDYPNSATAKVRLAGAGGNGSGVRLVFDGQTLAEHTWPATADKQPTLKLLEYTIPVTAGAHTLVLENPNGPDWFEFAGLDTGLTTSPLAAVGRRAADRVCLWLWHRDGVYTKNGAPTVAGTVVIDELPAGKWGVVWWDLALNQTAPAIQIAHSGGQLRLPTPPIGRHAAVSLNLLR